MEDFFLKVWAQIVDVHYTWQTTVLRSGRLFCIFSKTFKIHFEDISGPEKLFMIVILNFKILLLHRPMFENYKSIRKKIKANKIQAKIFYY